jgi:CubicO group peptidase (beta-lactamase class C family)
LRIKLKPMLMTSWLFIGFFPLAVSAADSSVIPDGRFAKIRSLIEARVADDIPSFGISVVHKGEVIWEEAFGWADIENQVAATPATMYSIASISKSITSTGVMLLAERGDLNLDDSIDEYLEEGFVKKLTQSKRRTTVRDLMTMTAGFPMGFMSTYDSSPAPDRDQLLKHHGALQAFAPGEVFHYSNFSLGVAELVIEDVTGQSFNDAMDEVLFEPLGMHSTAYSGSSKYTGNLAINYEPNGAPWPGQTSMPAGGAGSYSSIADLRRYALAHLGHPKVRGEPAGLISASVREAMHVNTTALSDQMFAAGWWSLDLGDGARLVVSDGHGAGMALVQLYPHKDLAVICVMNTRKNDPDGAALTNKVANQVFEIISPGFTALHDEFFAGLAASSLRNAFPTSEFIGRWSGYVRLMDDNRMSLEMLVQPDGDVHVTLEDQYTVLLTETRFQNGVLEGWFPGLIPVQVENDRVHDILGRFRFHENIVEGYLNANFDDANGTYDLPNLIHLKRESADRTLAVD